MVDYVSKAHNLHATASFLAGPDLTLNGSVNYNISQSALEQVKMPTPSAEVASSLSHQDFTFDDMHNYSKLDYGYLQLGFGAEYQVSPRFTITADVDYADFKDETGYVYGIESGTYLMVRTGVRLDF